MKKKISLVLISLFLIFGAPIIAHALPIGAILYRTSASGQMYGLNNFAVPTLPWQVQSGGVGLYLGKNKGIPIVLDLSYGEVRLIPAEYFVDLDLGEKFIGAKIPRNFCGFSQNMQKNILAQLHERYDHTFHQQKGPSSREWTSAGLIEKIYESARSSYLTYRPKNYAIDITPDGYDQQTIINQQGDCLSKTVEFSKIHQFTEIELLEYLTVGDLRDILNKTLQKQGINFDLNNLSAINVFGRLKGNNRYFFFPYTQYVQPSLRDVAVDIKVSSHHKAQLSGTLTKKQQHFDALLCFAEGVTKNVARETVKIVVEAKVTQLVKLVKLDRIKQAISKVKETAQTIDKSVRFFTKGKVNLGLEQLVFENKYIQQGKQQIKENKYISGALTTIEQVKDDVQASMREMNEVAELNKKKLFGATPEASEKQQQLLSDIPQLDKSAMAIVSSKQNQVSDNENRSELGVVNSILNLDPSKSPYLLRDIVINEVAWMGTVASSSNEWIELYNRRSKPINLTGWSLTISNRPAIKFIGTIPAHGFWLLERVDSRTISNMRANQIYHYRLTNQGEDLILRDNYGRIIDQLSFASKQWPAGSNSSSKRSMERINSQIDGSRADNWQNYQGTQLFAKDKQGNFIYGTPGRMNSSQTENQSVNNLLNYRQHPLPKTEKIVYSANDVVISELLSVPSKGQSEWIELYNNTNQLIDLADWTLENSSGRLQTLNSFFIFPHRWLLLSKGQQFKFSLNNQQDILQLKYLGSLINQVNYGQASAVSAPAKDDSLARINNIGNLTITTIPTPGRSNLIRRSGVVNDSSLPAAPKSPSVTGIPAQKSIEIDDIENGGGGGEGNSEDEDSLPVGESKQENSSNNDDENDEDFAVEPVNEAIELPHYYSLKTKSYGSRECIKSQTLSANRHYFITYSMNICPDTILNIEPGVVIKFGPRYTDYQNIIGISGIYSNDHQHGKIVARGTADNPIVFTSWRDDQYGGDLDGDIEKEQRGQRVIEQYPDYWGSIQLAGEGNVFDHTIIRYGGAKQRRGFKSNAVIVWSPQTIITNSLFERNVGNLLVKVEGAEISNNIYR